MLSRCTSQFGASWCPWSLECDKQVPSQRWLPLHQQLIRDGPVPRARCSRVSQHRSPVRQGPWSPHTSVKRWALLLCPPRAHGLALTGRNSLSHSPGRCPKPSAHPAYAPRARAGQLGAWPLVRFPSLTSALEGAQLYFGSWCQSTASWPCGFGPVMAGIPAGHGEAAHLSAARKQRRGGAGVQSSPSRAAPQ